MGSDVHAQRLFLATVEIGAWFYDLTPGTAAASKAVVLDANSKIDTLDITSLKIGGTPYKTKWPMAAYTSWQLANDGAQTNGAGMVGDVDVSDQLTCTVYDHGTTTYAALDSSDDLTGWAAAYQLSADSGAEEAGTDSDGQTDGDAAYFGYTIPFCELSFDLDTVGVNGAKVWRWEYYNGTQWNELTGLAIDNTDTANADGEQSFEQNGAVSFVPPSDWAAVAVNSVTKYWIRARVVAEQITTTPVMDGTEPDVVVPGDGFLCPHDGTITDIRVTDTAGTLHTGTDVKFILMNFTTGAHSGELTWAQDQRQDAWASLTLAVNAGDELGVLVTQEDSGNNDPTDVMIELGVTPS